MKRTTFGQMRQHFLKADAAASKGSAGPAPNKHLNLPEFLNVILRISFWRLNPEFGELLKEHGDVFTPVPQARNLCPCVGPQSTVCGPPFALRPSHLHSVAHLVPTAHTCVHAHAYAGAPGARCGA